MRLRCRCLPSIPSRCNARRASRDFSFPFRAMEKINLIDPPAIVLAITNSSVDDDAARSARIATTRKRYTLFLSTRAPLYSSVKHNDCERLRVSASLFIRERGIISLRGKQYGFSRVACLFSDLAPSEGDQRRCKNSTPLPLPGSLTTNGEGNYVLKVMRTPYVHRLRGERYMGCLAGVVVTVGETSRVEFQATRKPSEKCVIRNDSCEDFFLSVESRFSFFHFSCRISSKLAMQLRPHN